MIPSIRPFAVRPGAPAARGVRAASLAPVSTLFSIRFYRLGLASVLLMGLLALVGCERPLERAQVPIAWLVPVDTRYAPADTAWLQQRVPGRQVVLALTLRLDSSLRLHLRPHDLAAARQLAAAAARAGWARRLALLHEQPADTGAALSRHLLYAYAHALRALEGLPLSDSAVWLVLPSAPQLWPWPGAPLPDSLRPRTLTTRAMSAPSLEAYAPCPPSGRLGIVLDRPVALAAKAHARRLHPARAAQAVGCGASVLLGPLYLGGSERLLELKNALRFWPDSLRIEALVIGTTEPRPAFVDSLSPFGWAHADPATAELRQWLTDYAGGD